ncbi:MAG TPA: T9SS type A sorting domain-containing protein [Flavipsychrobacter sp.]|nr:T9SS type A sorting domain-containing protein [Flavipsychrobacter sp.]
MKIKSAINKAFIGALVVWLHLLSGGEANAQVALQLIAEAVYANDSVNYTLTDSTRYVYSGTRTSNMATGQHLYDTASHWATAAKVPAVRYLRTYDAANRIASHTTQQYKAGVWRNSLQYLYRYTPAGTYDTVWANKWDTANALWKTERIYQYKYDVKGRVDSIFWLKPSGSAFVTEAADAYHYTDTMLTKHTLDVWNDTLAQWDRWQLETWHYDQASGKQDTYELHRIDIQSITLQPERKEVYVYDGTKRVAGLWKYYWFSISQSWQGLNEYYYTYNSHNDVIEEVVNYWDLFAQRWGPLNKIYYYYDFVYNVTDVIKKQFDYPVYADHSWTKYLYNSNGLPIERTKYIWNDAIGTWLPEKSSDSKHLYYYNNSNNIKSAVGMPTDIIIYPNPAKNFVTISGSWQHIEKCTILLSDMQGRLVYQAYEMLYPNKGLSIPISNVADGQYILSINNGSEQMTKLLIIANQ